MKEQFDVVVIDDGINNSLSNIGELKYDMVIDDELDIRQRSVAIDSISHGTMCASIIKKYAPNQMLSSIQILDDSTHRGNKYKLIEALKWCDTHNIRLVSLSLGTIDFRDYIEIKNCVFNLHNENMILIAACNNKNVYTVPASLPNVIGVKCNRKLTDDQYRFSQYPFDGIDIIASGTHKLNLFSEEEKYIKPSNSMAAPLITAKIIHMLETNHHMNRQQIISNLNKEALYKHEVTIPAIDHQSYIDCACGYIESYPVDIPIIYINSKSTKGLLMSGLTDKFEEEGYFSVLVTNDYNYYEANYGVEYMPYNEQYSDRVLQSIYRKYNCDILIIDISSTNQPLDFLYDSKQWDVLIQIDDKSGDKQGVEITRRNKDQYILNINFSNDYSKCSEDEIDLIYSNIIKCFE